MTDITKCKGDGCHVKGTCYRFTATAGMLQSYFMNPPIKDGKCEYQWDTNINKIKTNPAFQINKIQTENLTLREISDAFDKEYKNENLNTNEK